MVEPVSRTAVAAGAEPGAWVGMRTRRAPGSDSKTSGGFISRASPSMPISIGPAESTRKLGVSHSSHPGKLWIRPVASRPTKATASLGPAMRAETTPRVPRSSRAASAPATEMVQFVGVVRHQQQVSGGVFDTVGSEVAQVEGAGVGADHVWQHVGGGLHLGVPIRRRLHDLGVQSHGGVVDEDPSVEPGQVDPALQPVVKGVQSPYHVVAVETEVESEMVARAGRHAHVGDAML